MKPSLTLRCTTDTGCRFNAYEEGTEDKDEVDEFETEEDEAATEGDMTLESGADRENCAVEEADKADDDEEEEAERGELSEEYDKTEDECEEGEVFRLAGGVFLRFTASGEGLGAFAVDDEDEVDEDENEGNDLDALNRRGFS